MTELKMLEEIVFVSMDKLEPMDGNPRKMTAADRENLADSIREYGMVDPLVVWAGVRPSRPRQTWKIIGGHQRFDVLKDMVETGQYDIGRVPVVQWFGSEEKALKLNLALNRIGGDWDYVALKGWFAKIEEQGDLELTGFTTEEIDFVRRTNDAALEDLNQPSFAQLSMFEHPSLDVGGRRTEGRTAELRNLPLDSVRRNKFNPSQMSEKRFAALKKNIAELGLLYPVLVRSVEDGYEIVDGEKRHAAYEALGRKTIPCIVTEMDDATAALGLLTADRLQGGFKLDDLRPLLSSLAQEESVGETGLRTLLDLGGQLKDYLDPAKLEDVQPWSEFLETLSEEERTIISELVDADVIDLADMNMVFMVPLTADQHEFVVSKFEASKKTWGAYLVELLGGMPDGDDAAEMAS